jgi:hypothetical protein
MPFPSQRGITGQLWYECARCGFMYPEGELEWQNGMRVCVEKCYHTEPTFTENFSRLRIPSDEDVKVDGGNSGGIIPCL